ncbi:MAG: hypothetical protein E4G94_07190 [ANME-2 cluster archaeon]|nr:MAG: hypothetical protein E4G94_07190 [ANME-2 cluster archaeon]
MKISTKVLGLIVLITAITLVVSSLPAFAGGEGNGEGNQNQGVGGGGSTSGNCLSYPVIWAEGVTKVLRGEYEVVNTTGVLWYWWGTDSDGTPLSCLPDPQNTTLCDDGDNITAIGPLPGPEPEPVPEVTLLSDEEPTEPDVQPLRKVWVQQDPENDWQAGSADWSATPVNIDWLDWGDSIESVDWTVNSKVRCEMVLSKDLEEESAMLQYFMYHVSGWGITEMWGISREVMSELDDDGIEVCDFDNGGPMLDDCSRASVYTPCARLTIQKLLVLREDPALDTLVWVPTEGWTGEGLINSSIFNAAVHEATGEGVGEFPAEINVKGKIMYGYTWSVRDLNDATVNEGGIATGDYRLTFSLDETCGSDILGDDILQNTFFEEGVTDFIENNTVVIVPVEGGSVTASEEPVTGATAVLDIENDLTYIDIRIA